MRSWRFHEFGSIRNLRLEEVEIPEPASDEALVKLRYAGLNPADRFLVMGLYAGAGTPPFSVGRDGCGTVVTPGAGGRFRPGDTVVLLRGQAGITRDGTLAEYVTVPEAYMARIPHWWSLEEGAGSLVLLASWQALVDVSRIQRGETVLITGGSGGVGVSSLILAKGLGARVISLSRSPEKREWLAGLGADHTFDPEAENLVSVLKDLGGVDIVVENVCGTFLAKSLAVANSCGRVCVIGALGGIRCEISPVEVIFKRLQIHGIQINSFTDEGMNRAWEGICRVLEPVQGKVPVDRIFPFEQVQEAFEHMRRGPKGKVIIGPIGEG